MILFMSLYNKQSKKVKKGIALGKLCLMNNKRINIIRNVIMLFNDRASSSA